MTLTFVASQKDYVPTVTGIPAGGGQAPSFWQDSNDATGKTWTCNFDVSADLTITVSVSKSPAIGIVSGSSGITTAANGSTLEFWNPSFSGSVAFATLTASDGQNSVDLYPSVNGALPYFSYPVNKHLECTLVVPAGYVPTVTMGSSLVELHGAQGNPDTYAFNLDNLTGDATLSISFASAPKVIATGSTPAAAGNAITFSNGATLTATLGVSPPWRPTEPSRGGNLSNGEAKLLVGSGSLQYDDWFTISWAYDAAYSLGPDDLVTNGKIIITNVTGGVDPTRNAIANDGSGMEGLAFLSAGATVTIRFVPDAGYQFTGVKANGTPIEGVDASNDRYAYTFTAEGMIHFSSSFEKFDDVVSGSASHVESASLENGAAAVGSGNAQLIVADGAVDNGIQVSLKNAAGDDATIQGVLSLTLSQIITKGAALEAGNITDETAWITQKTELDEPVTVSIVLDEGVVPDGSVVSVVRRHTDADGTVSTTLIEATYDAATRMLAFSSRLFSEFAIATKPAASVAPTSPAASPTEAVTPVATPADGSAVVAASIPETGDAVAYAVPWIAVVGAMFVGAGLHLGR